MVFGLGDLLRGKALVRHSHNWDLALRNKASAGGNLNAYSS